MVQIIFFTCVPVVFIGTSLYIESYLKRKTSWSKISTHVASLFTAGFVLFFAVIPFHIIVELEDSSLSEAFRSYFFSASILVPAVCVFGIICVLVLEGLRSLWRQK